MTGAPTFADRRRRFERDYPAAEARAITARPTQYSAPTLDVLYRIPDPFDTLEQWEQFEHRDLDGMDYAGVRREFDRLRLRLMLDRDPHPWLLTRLQLVKQAGERARQLAGGRHY